MTEQTDRWATDRQPETALVLVADGLALVGVHCSDGWAFAWMLDGEPLDWPNPHETGSAEPN